MPNSSSRSHVVISPKQGMARRISAESCHTAESYLRSAYRRPEHAHDNPQQQHHREHNPMYIVELRLDAPLHGICFFPNSFSATQCINHGHAPVNKQVTCTAQPPDKVTYTGTDQMFHLPVQLSLLSASSWCAQAVVITKLWYKGDSDQTLCYSDQTLCYSDQPSATVLLQCPKTLLQ